TRRSNLADDLDLLIGDLCSNWGFCNQLCAKELLLDGGELTAIEFAEAVIKAESMDPELEVTWLRRISRAFTERYRCNSISHRSYVAHKHADNP
ncbi:MAG TPA: hypothetical protein VNH64_01315, partial [Parvularculaceae bacterium]|nr:hypothetical protein [Parvularculaceae bacterium]